MRKTKRKSLTLSRETLCRLEDAAPSFCPCVR